MLTVFSFIFTLGLLVTIHEYGHFQVAKWCGVKVLKFSIGFGKPLWVKRFGIDNTELVIAAIPLGGYVKMLDEREFSDESNAPSYTETELKRAFNRQSVFKRIAIVIAGPVANLLLAMLLYWLLFMMGVVGIKPIVGKVAEHSPAAEANLAAGDSIQKINGNSVASWQEISWILLKESLKNNKVEVEVLNSLQKPQIHSLNIGNINADSNNKDLLNSLGITVFQPNIPARIDTVVKNSPADLAGLKTNDLLLSINAIKIKSSDDFIQQVRKNPKVALEVIVEREETEIQIKLTPEQVLENDEKIGRIGASFKQDPGVIDKFLVTTHYSVLEAFIKATEKTWDNSIFTLKMLGKMLTGQVSIKGISGPVTIASYAGQSASMGFKVFIGFLAIISISIGILNLLPIPVLDGGHLMYYMVEIFTGKPTSESVMIIGQKIGFTLLGFMMILAFYNDINRLITG